MEFFSETFTSAFRHILKVTNGTNTVEMEDWLDASKSMDDQPKDRQTFKMSYKTGGISLYLTKNSDTSVDFFLFGSYLIEASKYCSE